jgi:hypothetical protein
LWLEGIAKQQLDRNPFRIDCYHFSGLENQMSGALSSVMGGGGLGALLNIASMFFPPLAMASSLSNLLTEAIGAGIKGAVDTLVKEAGMPKFLGDIVKGVVDSVVPNQKQQSDSKVDAYTSEKFKEPMDDFSKQLTKDLVDKVKEDMGDRAKGKGSGSSSGAGGKKAAGSWLEAIARALGEVAGEKAAKMVDLSNQISEKAGDSSPESAKEMTALNAELSGTSQMFKTLQETMNTTVKSIGEGLSTVARKQ